MAVYGNTVLREGFFSNDDKENKVKDKLKEICKKNTIKKAIMVINLYYDQTIHKNVIDDLNKLFDFLEIGPMMKVTGDYNYFYQSFYGIKNNVFYRFSLTFIHEEVRLGGYNQVFSATSLSKLEYDKDIVLYIFKNFKIESLYITKNSITLTSPNQSSRSIYDNLEKYINSKYKDKYNISVNNYNMKIKQNK